MSPLQALHRRLCHRFGPAETAVSTDQNVVVSPGARIEVRQLGSRGPAVLLLHGGPGCPDYLEPVATLLSARHRTVRFDQRGVGGSTCDGSYQPSDYIADIEAVRESLGLDALHVLGHSWGGLLAQLYALYHPGCVQSLCLISSAAGVGQQWTEMTREVVTYNRQRSGPFGFALMGLSAAGSLLPSTIGRTSGRRLLARVWRNYFPPGDPAPSIDAKWLAGANTTAARRTVRAIRDKPATTLDALRDLAHIPVLVLSGDDDIAPISVRHLRDRFPDAQHVILPNCGHIPWLQAPEAFGRVMAEFYRSIAAPT